MVDLACGLIVFSRAVCVLFVCWFTLLGGVGGGDDTNCAYTWMFRFFFGGEGGEVKMMIDG